MNLKPLPLLILTCCIVFVGCNRPLGINNASSLLPNTKQADWADVVIGVNLVHPCGADMEYNISRETDDSIFITSDCLYYNAYASGKRFEAPLLTMFAESKENLTVQLDIVNNNDTPLDIEEIRIDVDKSTPDSTPRIFVCTEYNCSNTITFINDSWYNWKGFTFHYTILRKGEKFDGNYRYHSHINYFEESKRFNLLPELMKLGYDYRNACKQLDSFNEYLNYNPRDCQRMIDKGHNFYDEYDENQYYTMCCNKDFSQSDTLDRIFYPFEVTQEVYIEDGDTSISPFFEGRAELYGRLEFDNSDFSVDFKAQISLFHYCGGAGVGEDDRFHVALHANDSNYQLRYPFTTVVEPYGTEMLTLIISVPQASYHNLRFVFPNGNDKTIRSKDIFIHSINPRHYIIDCRQ